LTVPNLITLFRIILVPCFFTALVSYESGKEGYRWLAFWLLLLAAASDALDGFLARVLKQQSQLGRILDPIADKLLILSGFLGLLYVEMLPLHPPLWVTVIVVFRDMVLLLGLFVFFLISRHLPAQPNLLGKMTTVMQMITLISVLLQWAVSPWVWNITAVMTIMSGVIYVMRELKVLNGEST
jgi:cardiolipin synthase (CMP-forming)